MRTTMTIDDEVYEMAHTLAEARHISLGKALSDLARKGAQSEMPTYRKSGLILFDLPKDSPRVDMQQVKRLESEIK